MRAQISKQMQTEVIRLGPLLDRRVTKKNVPARKENTFKIYALTTTIVAS